MTFVFLNQDQSVVGRIDEDGKMRVSGDATAWSEYLSWLEEGNTTLPYTEPESEPAPELTPAEKLAASGLSVAELKELLGLD